MGDIDYLVDGLPDGDEGPINLSSIPEEQLKRARFTQAQPGWMTCGAKVDDPVWGKYANRTFRVVQADGGLVIELVTNEGEDSKLPPLDELRNQIAPGEEDLGTRIEQHNQQKELLKNELQKYQDDLTDIAALLQEDLGSDAGMTNMLVQEQTNMTDQPHMSQVASRKTAEVAPGTYDGTPNKETLQPPGGSPQQKADKKDFKEDQEELAAQYGGDERERETPQSLEVEASLFGDKLAMIPDDMNEVRAMFDSWKQDFDNGNVTDVAQYLTKVRDQINSWLNS